MKIFITLLIVSATLAFAQTPNLPQGELIEGFEALTGWTFEGNGVYTSLENIKTQGAASVKLGTTLNEKATMTKTVSLNFSEYQTFSIDLYTPDFSTALKRSIRIEISSSASFSRYFRANIYAGNRLHVGWNRLYFSKGDFLNWNNLENWSNTMVKISFTEWIENNVDYQPSLTIIDNFIGYKTKPPAIAIITFDDNEKSTVTLGKPIMDALGFKGVQFVIGNTANQMANDRLNWNDYDSLYSQGWDVSNHTYSHPQLSTLDSATLEFEINGMRDLLLAHGYTRSADFFSYPYSEFNVGVINKVAQRHKLARNSEDWRYTAHPTPEVGDYFLLRKHADFEDITTHRADIDKAIERGQLLVYLFHDITDIVGKFSDIMSYLKAKQDAGLIQVMTMSEYWQFINAVQPGITVKAKVFLQGPYNSLSSNMNTGLPVPLTSPYQDARVVTTVPANVVDWIYVELKNSASGPAIASRSAFLKNDGTIVGDDGVSDISFPFYPGQYFISIKHRNHLAIMSSSLVELSAASTLYDFTIAQNKAYTTGPNSMAALPGGSFGMFAGDANGNGSIDHSTDILTKWFPDSGTVGYNSADFNMDGTVDFVNDIYKWLGNFGLSSHVPFAALNSSVADKLEQAGFYDKLRNATIQVKHSHDHSDGSCKEYDRAKWEAENGTTTDVNKLEDKSLPKEFSVSQNYPNPFNPVTNFEYRLAENAMVTITLYNTLGEKVSTLLQQSKDAGTHNLKIDGNQLASGVYILNVSIDGASEKKTKSIKLSLLK